MQPKRRFGLAIARSVEESYVSSSDAARILKLDPPSLEKITGSLKVDPGRYDLGLNLKYSEGSCRFGYTREREEKGKKRGENKAKASRGSGGSFSWLSVVPDSVRKVATIEKNGSSGEYSPKAMKLFRFQAGSSQLFQSLFQQTREKKHTATGLFAVTVRDASRG